MGQRPEGKRRAPVEGPASSTAAPAEMARVWAAASAAHEMLRKRRLYWLATEAEERVAEQLSLVPLLQDWLPATSDEVAELTTALRAYAAGDDERDRDKEAVALGICIRAMTMSRARNGIPFPPDVEALGGPLIS